MIYSKVNRSIDESEIASLTLFYFVTRFSIQHLTTRTTNLSEKPFPSNTIVRMCIYIFIYIISLREVVSLNTCNFRLYDISIVSNVISNVSTFDIYYEDRMNEIYIQPRYICRLKDNL